MKKKNGWIVLLSLLFLFAVTLGSYSAIAQDRPNMTKWEYYSQIAKEHGWVNKLARPGDFADRKLGLLDVGKVRTEIQNTNRLGYSREMITWEYPKGSGITYQWCEALIVGGILNGEKRVSNGALGAYETVNENHYEPYGGYDSGIGANGMAMSNHPNSWAPTWPPDSGPIGSLGFPGVMPNGDVAGDAEAFWVAGDDLPDCQQDTPLHLKTYGRALQWSSPLADDFIVFKFFVKNIGTDTIKDCYVGVHTDMDAPEQGSSEWMDDFAAFISEDEDSILGNMLYIWDGDDKSAGYVEKGVAWQGLKFLETPKRADGTEIGLTTLVCETYDDFIALPDQPSLYDWLARGIDQPDNVQPHPNDWTQTPNTYGPDVTSLHATGPFDLAPGEEVTFTFANIFGANKAELMANATLCQLLYDKQYKTAQPPEEPHVTAVVGDQQVTLYWDAEPSESSVDPLTGNNRFEGYRIYRSTDRGRTWGDPITNANGAVVGYVPLAQYDLKDGITGISEADPFFNLGTDSGLKHKFVDKNLKNGVEYWYAVCAYDADDKLGDLVIPPLENARHTDADIPNDNTVRVIPQAPPAGKMFAQISEIEHVSGNSAGTVQVEVLNDDEVVDGTYEVHFTEDPNQGTLVSVTLNGETVMGPVPVVQPGDLNVDRLPVFNGMRLIAIDAEKGIDESATGAVVGDSLWLGYWGFENENGSGLADDYEIRFTPNGSIAFQYSSPYGPVHVPYEVWNITTNMQINSDVYDRGDESFDIEKRDYIFPVNTAYDSTQYVSSWPDDYNYYFRFSTDSKYHVGDVFRIVTFKPFTSNDVYKFTATGAKVAAKEEDLKQIRVIPNPYAITSPFEYSEQEWVKELQFHGLPERCTIRIFTISGDLVAILHHEPGDPGYRGPAVQAWNLWTYNDQEVAFGVYIFHVKAPGIGERLGKFAIIK